MRKRSRGFNARAFLDSAGLSKKIVDYRRAETIFSQGDPAGTVMYIRHGGVQLSVLSRAGREAVVAVLGPGDFFGEGCLSGQPTRIGSAIAVTRTSIMQIDKKLMAKVLHEQHSLSARFLSHVLLRNVRIEQDLIDQLFNSNEKRLARALLRLARFGRQDTPRRLVGKLSREMLAELSGTTPARVGRFMSKFRKLGFIDYGADLGTGVQINNSLLGVLLHD
jgi:CRP/FNR family transcriptional regulator, cyclic AMP receptor protein